MRLYKKNRRVVIYGMKILLAIGILLNEGLLLAESSESEVVELFRYGQVQRNPNAYTIGKKGGVFLKIIENKKDQCLKLDQSGNYPIEKLNEELLVPANASGFFNCNLRALISRLKTPAQMLITPEPRGLSDGEPKEDVVFEDIWRQVAVEMSAKVPAENMLAAAVWYSGEKRNFARSAYILEKAHNYYHNNWFLELHHDAYALTSPTLIDQEIQKTKSEYLDIYSKNNKIALLTGIQNYVNSAEWPELQTPLRDIEKLKDVLVREYNYDPDNIIMLPNATYQGLLDALRDLRGRINSRTNLLVYYAGHGLVDDGEYFWVPSDGGKSPKSWIYTEYILRKIRSLNTLHTLLVVDSCFSGALNSHEPRSKAIEGVLKLYQKPSRQLITSGSNEPVADQGGKNHSVFAQSLIQILEDQPENQPLSTEELFSKLQPSVVKNSNQTPTYDRILNSNDRWGQFYFVKKPLLMAQQEKEIMGKTSAENLPAHLINSLEVAPSGKVREGSIELFLSRDDTEVFSEDIIESEIVSLSGVSLSYKIQVKNEPVRFQLKYSLGIKEKDDTIEYQQNKYQVPETINSTDLLMGLRTIPEKKHTRWTSEAGLYYHWKRVQVEWDTSGLAFKKTESEFVNRGYHLLDYQNYTAWKPSDLLELGCNYNIQAGLVTMSGSTQVARNEKYNTDTSNFILGINLGPEFRFRLPVIPLELYLGASFEYLWQPMDDEGGNGLAGKINATQRSIALYAIFGLSF